MDALCTATPAHLSSSCIAHRNSVYKISVYITVTVDLAWHCYTYTVSARPEVTKGQPTGMAEPISHPVTVFGPQHVIVIHFAADRLADSGRQWRTVADMNG